MGSALNTAERLFNAADARAIIAARTLHDYLDKLVKAKLLVIGSDEEVVMCGLISRLEDLRTALMQAPMSPDCPLCWRTLEQRAECTDSRCIKGLR